MKITVLGFGSMGRRHARNARQCGHDVLVYDPNPLIEQKEFDSTTRPTVAFEADRIVIASPAMVHADQVRQCIEAGVPFLVEKPLALSAMGFFRGAGCVPDDASRVGYNLRFHRGLLGMRKLLPGIGAPTSARFVMRCRKSAWPGSFYQDMLIESSHEIDLAIWMLGPCRVVGAVGSGDRWSVLLRHDSGCATEIVLDGTYHGYLRTAEVAGPDGVLTHEWWDLDWRWRLSGPGCGQGVDGRTTPEETYLLEMRSFLKGGPGCTVFEGLSVLRVCDETRMMARS